MILLERSYKKIIGDEDALLVYFLSSVEMVEWGVSLAGIAEYVVEKTF